MDSCLLTLLSLCVDFHYTLKIIPDVSFSLINENWGQQVSFILRSEEGPFILILESLFKYVYCFQAKKKDNVFYSL